MHAAATELDQPWGWIATIEENHTNRTNFDIDSNTSDKMSPLLEQVIESNQNNELCSKIC